MENVHHTLSSKDSGIIEEDRTERDAGSGLQKKAKKAVSSSHSREATHLTSTVVTVCTFSMHATARPT